MRVCLTLMLPTVCTAPFLRRPQIHRSRRRRPACLCRHCRRATTHASFSVVHSPCFRMQRSIETGLLICDSDGNDSHPNRILASQPFYFDYICSFVFSSNADLCVLLSQWALHRVGALEASELSHSLIWPPPVPLSSTGSDSFTHPVVLTRDWSDPSAYRVGDTVVRVRVSISNTNISSILNHYVHEMCILDAFICLLAACLA